LEQELQRAQHYAETSAQQLRNLHSKEHGDSPHSKRFCPPSSRENWGVINEASEQHGGASENSEEASSSSAAISGNRILDPALQHYASSDEALHADSTEAASATQHATNSQMPFSQGSPAAFSPY